MLRRPALASLLLLSPLACTSEPGGNTIDNPLTDPASGPPAGNPDGNPDHCEARSIAQNIDRRQRHPAEHTGKKCEAQTTGLDVVEIPCTARRPHHQPGGDDNDRRAERDRRDHHEPSFGLPEHVGVALWQRIKPGIDPETAKRVQHGQGEQGATGCTDGRQDARTGL